MRKYPISPVCLEQAIRGLDQRSRSFLRLGVGEAEEPTTLEILGGNGQYVLREMGDGWVYYEPAGGEEEVEVCSGAQGYRCPAYYVCTSLGRVLEIALHFCETGTFEETE